MKNLSKIFLGMAIFAVVYGSLVYFLDKRKDSSDPYTLRCFIGGEPSSPSIVFLDAEIRDGLWVLRAADNLATYRPYQGEICIAAREK